MARQTKIIDVFLSSPNDVAEERSYIVTLSNEWNTLHSRSRNVFINVITWEDAVTSAMSDRPQSVVNEQVGDDYDAYLGLMWGRFGSPTGVAESGTVEEYERALERYRNGNGVRLAMLFKVADIPTRILDGNQYDKVRTFKDRFSKDGGFYQEFSNTDQLRIAINRFFEIVVNDTSMSKSLSSNMNNNTVALEEDNSEMGLLEWQEELTNISSGQSDFMGRWAQLLDNSTEITRGSVERLGDIAKFGAADPAAVNNVMREVALGLDELSGFLEQGLGDFSSNNDRLIFLTNEGFGILSDFNDEDQQTEWASSVIALAAAAASNKVNISELSETMRGIPRLSTIFNKSRNRFLRQQDRLLNEMGRLEHIANSRNH